MATEIKKYQYAWNPKNKTGHLRLKFKNQEKWTKWGKWDNISEFNIIISMLQTEKPVYFVNNDSGRYFQTSPEIVGEDEN